MAENDVQNCSSVTDFREAVCIDAGRVYDSCCDRDCLEDLRCYFTHKTQELLNCAINVRLRSAEVLNVAIDVQPVSFNRGYYSCDLTFFFLVCFDLYTDPNSCPTQINGLCCFNKKAILFGSDGNVKVFSSTVNDEGDNCNQTVLTGSNMPKCVVQCVDPIALSSCLGTVRERSYCKGCVPQAVSDYLGEPIVTELEDGSPTVFVTLGLFTIIQLVRNVQMLIPVYDFCIPEKQCTCETNQPCDVFRSIDFPTDEFFPPRPANLDNGGCGCGNGNDCCDECD